MQNRYVGDIGDFVKYSLLRRLGVDRHLGILWWLYPDEAHNSDGKHIGYLKQPIRWRDRDEVLFDGLSRIVDSGQRHVHAIQEAGLLGRAVFFDTMVPIPPAPRARSAARLAWIRDAEAHVDGCDVVFIDPDNGFETTSFSTGSRLAGKSVTLDELVQLRRLGRTLVVYHHQTRMPGGHLNELAYWGGRLGARGFTVDTLRSSAHSARAFFMLDADTDLRMRAVAMAKDWGDKLTWYPDLHHAPYVAIE